MFYIYTNNDAEKDFLSFARNYFFYDVERKWKKEKEEKSLFGLKKSKYYYPYEKEVRYNDFSFHVCDEGLIAESGANGSYRPEGYMWGSEEMDNKIKNRLLQMINDYNKSSDKFVASLDLTATNKNLVKVEEKIK